MIALYTLVHLAGSCYLMTGIVLMERDGEVGMTDADVLGSIERMRRDHIQHGGEPKKITMSRKNFVEMVSGIRELICIDAGDHPEYSICGMAIEIRDDVDPETLFIVS